MSKLGAANPTKSHPSLRLLAFATIKHWLFLLPSNNGVVFKIYCSISIFFEDGTAYDSLEISVHIHFYFILFRGDNDYEMSQSPIFFDT